MSWFWFINRGALCRRSCRALLVAVWSFCAFRNAHPSSTTPIYVYTFIAHIATHHQLHTDASMLRERVCMHIAHLEYYRRQRRSQNSSRLRLPSDHSSLARNIHKHNLFVKTDTTQYWNFTWGILYSVYPKNRCTILRPMKQKEPHIHCEHSAVSSKNGSTERMYTKGRQTTQRAHAVFVQMRCV